MTALRALPLLVLAVTAVAVPMAGSDYGIAFAIQVLVFIALGYSWNLIGGYAGYTHFGQMSFFGVGAYVGTLLILRAGWHWLPAAAMAGASGALLALPLGGAMLRLKGPFFAIGMFGLTRVWESLALGLDRITDHPAAAQQVHDWLQADLGAFLPDSATPAQHAVARRIFQVGQPVTVAIGSDVGVLSIAASTRLVSAEPSYAASSLDERLARAILDAETVLQKVSLILQYWPSLGHNIPTEASS